MKQWQDLLNSAGEGIFGLDLNGNTTFINPAAARMVGVAVHRCPAATIQDRHSRP
jgi:PAS domain-containing protein